MTESESGVLPLHYTSIFDLCCRVSQQRYLLYTIFKKSQPFFIKFFNIFLFCQPPLIVVYFYFPLYILLELIALLIASASSSDKVYDEFPFSTGFA